MVSCDDANCNKRFFVLILKPIWSSQKPNLGCNYTYHSMLEDNDFYRLIQVKFMAPVLITNSHLPRPGCKLRVVSYRVEN